ncbi:murein hydrolase activator EnvC family protein [Roseburia hominis]|uniref:murein hydrolase activator EnvC family protein n=1 Tax=Roseburia hominis TaxID=301301 RepID=UPI0026F039BC|nr:M23 family metallopeptidase [Roseburia hominis]MCI7521787.1 peptidoglycan DD-metalloendopeptidase family protein [Roseburia hominis]
MIRRITALGLVLVLAAGIPIQASSVATEKATEDAASTKSLQEAQDEKAQLEKALKEAQSTIEDLKDSKGDIESKVTELNQQLIDISARITDLENQLTAKSEDIQETKDELAGAKEREAQQYADMKVRIQFMYENWQTSYLEALLSSRNISEFLNSADYIAQIQSYDRQKLTEYQDTVESIVNLEAQLEQEYTDLEALKSTVESNKATVAAMMRQKESELADISGDIEDAQSDADYYAAEIQAQEELIAAIKRAEAEKAAAGVEEHPYTGGAFRWPCPSSTRVTSDYGTRVSPMSGASSNHKGIDIGASAGADIIAAADGTVTAASYSSAAGNYVMIDHGGGLYTVYMHASSLLVSPGQTVSAGDVIAKVGSTGISTGSHLHFGVSLNGSYVSPWSYLGG